MHKYVDTCAVFAIISAALGAIVLNKPIKLGIAIFDPAETRNRYTRSIIDSLTGVKFVEFKTEGA
jgi:hypothetical protein